MLDVLKCVYIHILYVPCICQSSPEIRLELSDYSQDALKLASFETN